MLAQAKLKRMKENSVLLEKYSSKDEVNYFLKTTQRELSLCFIEQSARLNVVYRHAISCKNKGMQLLVQLLIGSFGWPQR